MSVQTAVVLMNLGGPDSLEAVEPFLYNIFSDPDVIQLPLGFLYQKAFARRIAKSRAPESAGFYRRIGGRSPILELTRKQGALLDRALGAGFRTYVAMRAWKPFTEEAVDALLADGSKAVVALPLYPHRSRTTSVSSLRELKRVLARKNPALPVHEVCCYPTEPGFLDGWAERIRATLAAIPPERREKAHLLFSAHSLPQSVIDRGDPYLSQIQATIAGVMQRLEPGQIHSLAFQSKATRVKWLGPSTQDALGALAHAGVQDVAVVPIAFLTDHIETLYELDMLIKDHAAKVGIPFYHRVAALNGSGALIAGLARLVRKALASDRPVCEGGPVPCPRV